MNKATSNTTMAEIDDTPPPGNHSGRATTLALKKRVATTEMAPKDGNPFALKETDIERIVVSDYTAPSRRDPEDFCQPRPAAVKKLELEDSYIKLKVKQQQGKKPSVRLLLPETHRGPPDRAHSNSSWAPEVSPPTPFPRCKSNKEPPKYVDLTTDNAIEDDSMDSKNNAVLNDIAMMKSYIPAAATKQGPTTSRKNRNKGRTHSGVETTKLRTAADQHRAMLRLKKKGTVQGATIAQSSPAKNGRSGACETKGEWRTQENRMKRIKTCEKEAAVMQLIAATKSTGSHYKRDSPQESSGGSSASRPSQEITEDKRAAGTIDVPLATERALQEGYSLLKRLESEATSETPMIRQLRTLLERLKSQEADTSIPTENATPPQVEQSRTGAAACSRLTQQINPVSPFALHTGLLPVAAGALSSLVLPPPVLSPPGPLIPILVVIEALCLQQQQQQQQQANKIQTLLQHELLRLLAPVPAVPQPQSLLQGIAVTPIRRTTYDPPEG